MGILRRLLTEADDTAEEAHKKGWTYKGRGYWGNAQGQTVAQTVDGKLVPYRPADDFDKNDYQARHAEKFGQPQKAVGNKTAVFTKRDPKDPNAFWKGEIPGQDPSYQRMIKQGLKNPDPQGVMNRLEAWFKQRGSYKDPRYADLTHVAAQIAYPAIVQNGNVDLQMVEDDGILNDGREIIELYKMSNALLGGNDVQLDVSTYGIAPWDDAPSTYIEKIDHSTYPYLSLGKSGNLFLDPSYNGERPDNY